MVILDVSKELEKRLEFLGCHNSDKTAMQALNECVHALAEASTAVGSGLAEHHEMMVQWHAIFPRMRGHHVERA